ncbi:MAG TPA: hypothetical protein VIJ04_22405 [Xanthobacteraceae bacterium]
MNDFAAAFRTALSLIAGFDPDLRDRIAVRIAVTVHLIAFHCFSSIECTIAVR